VDTISVLLIDDSSFFRRLAARFLASAAGVRLLGAAAGGDEALALAADLRPQVILLDLNLPGQGGLALLPRLRQIVPGGRIIILTLWESDVYRQAALAAGADAFVPKSQIATELVPAIRGSGKAAIPMVV
jgi:DNA-binding NarL/FixJ family response regulator